MLEVGVARVGTTKVTSRGYQATVIAATTGAWEPIPFQWPSGASSVHDDDCDCEIVKVQGGDWRRASPEINIAKTDLHCRAATISRKSST